MIFLLFVFMADMTSVVNSQSKTTVSLSCYDIQTLGFTYGTFTGNLSYSGHLIIYIGQLYQLSLEDKSISPYCSRVILQEET